MHRLTRATLVLLATAAPDAIAHDATAVARVGVAEPFVFALIAVAGAGYVAGIFRLWRAAGRGRGIGLSRVLVFACGMALLALTLSPQVDAFTHRSFAAHMVQHEVLMLAVAPLLVAGRPLAAWAWGLPVPARRVAVRVTSVAAWRRAWHSLTSLRSATLLQLVLMTLWHVPALFDAALGNPWLHALQHSGFLGSALAFWWAILRPSAAERAWPAAFALFLTMIATGALGALLTIAPTPLYSAYGRSSGALEDQQLGGLIMWVPGGAAYLLAAIVLVARWLRLQRRMTGFPAVMRVR